MGHVHSMALIPDVHHPESKGKGKDGVHFSDQEHRSTAFSPTGL